MTVKEALAQLSKSDRARLQYAFENRIPDYVQDGSRFVGVNAEHISFLTITEQAGAWSIGSVNDSRIRSSK